MSQPPATPPAPVLEPQPPHTHHPRHLLTLPTELLLLIIQFASSSPPPSSPNGRPTGLQTLLNLSRTCKSLCYTIFARESDEAIWRHIAITRLGTHPNLPLDKVLYPGLSSKRLKMRGGQKRWRDVVKLGIAWERPFPVREQPDGSQGPEGEWKVKKALRSFRPLPAPRGSERDNGWAVEMVCPGDGDARTQKFETKMPVGDADEGRITFQVKRMEGGVRQQGMAAVPASEAKTRTITAVVDLLGKGGARVGSRIRKGKGKSKVVCEEVKPGMGWTMTPHPGFCGFVTMEVERKDAEGKPAKGWVIKQVDSLSGTLVEDRIWDLGGRRPDRFVGEGDVVVALCFDDPDQPEPSDNPEMPSNLVCIERVMDKNVGWLGKGQTWRSRVRWSVNTSREWAEESNYTAFAHLKNFHATKHHVVALVTRHPGPYTQKLTGTFFHVLDIQTGKIVNKLKLRKRITPPTSSSASAAGAILPRPPPPTTTPLPQPTALPPQTTPAAAAPTNIFLANPLPQAPTTPAAFTTAFNHDFLLTDNFLVCGGPGGGLHVYNYTLRATPNPQLPYGAMSPGGSPLDDGNKPLYSLPDPWTPYSPFYKHNPDLAGSIPTDAMQGMFVGRQYSGLTLSTCGRYLGATTSDQFWVWDMQRKRVRGVWGNGRKVERRDWYSRSPVDGWVGGVWVLLNYQEEDGTVGRRKGKGVRERIRGGMGKGKHMEKGAGVGVVVGLGGDDGWDEGEEGEEGEVEEIMVGYLTDLGVPERGGEGGAGGDGSGRAGLRLGLGVREGWQRGVGWVRGLEEVDLGSVKVLGLMAVVVAVFAVVMAKGWLGGYLDLHSWEG